MIRPDSAEPGAIGHVRTELVNPLDWLAANRPKVLHPTRGYIEYESRDYQRELLADWLHPNRIIVKARQIGITQTLAVEMYIKNAVNGFPLSLCVSRQEDQAKEVIKYVRMLSDPKTLRTDNKTEIEFANGCRVVAQAAGKDAGRGFPASDVYLDEMAFMQWAQDIYQSIEPTLSNGGRITIFSSPKGKANLFYQIWNGMFGGDDVWKRYDFPYSVLWDEEWAARKQEKMTREGFAEEYLASRGFLATGGQLFGEDDLAACYHPDGTQGARTDGHRYLLSADVAGSGADATVLQVWDVTSAPYRLAHQSRWIIGAFEKAYAEAEKLFRAYKPYAVWVDDTGLGKPMVEEFTNRLKPLGGRVHGFTFTHKSKAEALTALRLLVENHEIMYDDLQLHSELGIYQEDDKDLVTDCVMAAAIMASATRRKRLVMSD